jgi:hypothetical protein
MSTSVIDTADGRLLGMFELDASDTVIYARVEGAGHSAPAPGPLGRALFEWAAPFANADELRRRIHYFRSNGAPADGFDFQCEYADGEMPVRVLLARVRDFTNQRTTKSILVHIRQRS